MKITVGYENDCWIWRWLVLSDMKMTGGYEDENDDDANGDS